MSVLFPIGEIDDTDRIRGGKWQDVVGWHVAELCSLGMVPTAVRPVVTPSMRAGANGALRVDAEMVIRFEFPAFAHDAIGGAS